MLYLSWKDEVPMERPSEPTSFRAVSSHHLGRCRVKGAFEAQAHRMVEKGVIKSSIVACYLWHRSRPRSHLVTHPRVGFVLGMTVWQCDGRLETGAHRQVSGFWGQMTSHCKAIGSAHLASLLFLDVGALFGHVPEVSETCHVWKSP